MVSVLNIGILVNIHDLFIMLAMGSLAIGLGISLVYLAAPFIPAPEVSIIVLLESLLGPIWVWVVLQQPMRTNEIWGGALVFFAVVSLSYFSSKDKSYADSD
jgi:drug/metabolite transporter (DMT)-like permease